MTEEDGADLRARELIESLKFKETREQIAEMSVDEYRAYLQEKLGTGKWAEREIELLVKAKQDGEAFLETFRERNGLNAREPIEKDFRSYLKEEAHKP